MKKEDCLFRLSRAAHLRATLWMILLCGLFCVTAQNMYAQEGFRITGTVTDEKSGELLAGASVIEKGTTNGIITDVDGHFTLNVRQDAVLQISYIGYIAQEVAVGGQTTLLIRLREDLKMLEEIVVVGYGTKRKGDITSAISVIDLDNLGDIHGLDATRLIQGQAPGVVVKQKTGKPGQEMSITIRGLGSLGAQSAPLYVVDGFPVGESLSQSLNPEDIESISILKDAASTSIYGARGANGVILITTKGAKDGELRLTATANLGVSNIPTNRRIKMMNGPEFIQFQKEAFEDRVRYLQHREPTLEDVPEAFRYPEQTKYSTDWFDEIMNDNALTQNYNVTLAEGTGKVKSVLSLGYLKQDGVVINTGFERFNARANIQGEVNEHIAVGWNIAASRSNERMVDSEGRGSIIGFTYWADPSEPVYNEDGTWNDHIGGHDGIFSSANPVQVMHEEKKLQSINRVLSNGYVEITFLKDFKFKPSVNVSLYNLRRNDFRPSTLAGGGYNVSPPPRDATMSEWNREILNYNADLLLTYAKKLGDHTFDAMLGYTAQAEDHKEMYGTGSKFPNDEIRIFQNAENLSLSSTFYEWSLLAYLARANYNYKDKYLASVSFRREGSSRFGTDNKWGNFPSASLGWRLSEEPFMPKLSWLGNLKLRGSYGVTGNNSIGNYPSLAGLSSANYVLNGGLAAGAILSSYANALLGWERSNALDLGVDMSLFNNKLVFMAEYYNRITDNMLLQKEIPIITGFGSTYTNVGKVQNRGVELSLDYRENVTKDLRLRGNFNIAFNRNKVLEIMGENDYIERYSFYNMYNRSIVGHPIGMLWGYKVLGIFNSYEEIAASPLQEGAVPGVYKYWDANGDGVITYDNKDMVETGNPHPKFTWALTLGAEYRNFDLNVLITGAQDYDLQREIEATIGNMDGCFNVAADTKNRWRSPESPGNGIWPSSNTWKWEREVNSRYVYDASHAWFKSISLGYTVPRGKSILKGARFFLNAENALLITNYPGFNPDVDMDGGINLGRDDEAYPIPLILSIGTTITF
ncbi:MAG: TonB-dependent receptor [Tannerella sp.]|jgi:TonB-linked SusC/RagA family outer membrane protein|nr:TonB-dependent receptor [Tannerella sp.]